VIFGVIAGCECYGLANSLKFFRIVFKILISYLLLKRFSSSVVLLLIDIALIVIVMIVQLYYIRVKINIKIRFYFLAYFSPLKRRNLIQIPSYQ
jgi:hypothetical protein